MHYCLAEYAQYFDHQDVTVIDAIADRQGVTQDTLLEQRCTHLFSNYKNEFIVFVIDTLTKDPALKERAEWGIRTMAALRALYCKKGITVVAALSIPHRFVDQLFPSMR